MTNYRLATVFIFGLIIFLTCFFFAYSTATAADLTVKPAKYDQIKAKLDSGQEGIVYTYDPVTGAISVQYRIVGMDTATYDYFLRVYSNYHSDILYEQKLAAASGSATINAAKVPNGTYWINLQRWVKGDEAAQNAYCQKNGYPCEIGKNLDMERIDIGSASKQGDEYQSFISGAIDRSGQPVKGAAWTNR